MISRWQRTLLRQFRAVQEFFLWTGRALFGLCHQSLRGAVSRLLAGWRQRRRIYLVQGLPALLVFLTLSGFLLAAAFAAPERNGWYERMAAEALRAKNRPVVQLCLERLARLAPDRADYRFRLAQFMYSEGQVQRAVKLIESLNSDDGPGFAPAHLWLAEMCLTATPGTPLLHREAEVHLLKALKLQPDNSTAHVILGKMYARDNRPDLAQSHLTVALAVHPELALDLAEVEKKLGQTVQSRARAEAALLLFRKRVDTAEQDGAARVDLAKTLIFLEDFPAAVAVLQQGLAQTGHDRYRLWLGSTYARWIKSLPDRTDAEKGRRLVLIQQGLRDSPRSPDLLMLLGEATAIDRAAADQSRELLQSLLAEGKASATLHLVLGLDAYRRKKLDAAREHFEQAERFDPGAPAIANNLARALANTEPTDLPRALQMMDAVLERSPRNPNFHETRGQILAKAGRWKEAVADLETALMGMPADKKIHRTLAQAYEHLGLPELSRLHQQKSEEAKP